MKLVVKHQRNEQTLLNIVKLIILNILHWVSFLSIRDKNIWVFGSWDGKSFLDNSKYLYLASQKLFPTIKPVWISNNVDVVESLRTRGFKAYGTWQIRAILYGLRAKYYFIDHAPLYGGFFAPTNLWLSGGAKIIQLWHGLPLKRLDSAGLMKLNRPKTAELLSGLSNLSLFNLYINHYVVAPSQLFGKLMAEAFQIPEKRILYSAYPRNVFQNIPHSVNFSLHKRINKKINDLKNEGKKIIFYIPTFRDYGGNPIKDSAINLGELKKFISVNQCALVVKFHEADEFKLEESNAKNLIFLPSGYDVYETLDLVDVLITDYSSIFFDFLWYNRPVVFYPYDLAEYQRSARCFYFDYKYFVPGSIVYSFNELLKLLSKILTTGVDDYQDKRERLRDNSFEYQRLILRNILVDY